MHNPGLLTRLSVSHPGNDQLLILRVPAPPRSSLTESPVPVPGKQRDSDTSWGRKVRKYRVAKAIVGVIVLERVLTLLYQRPALNHLGHVGHRP